MRLGMQIAFGRVRRKTAPTFWLEIRRGWETSPAEEKRSY